MRSVGIIGWGKYLPEKVLTNYDFVAMGLDTSDEWITNRSGIKERRIASDKEATSDLAVKAGKQAIERAGLKPKDIDLLIVATTSPDYLGFPSTSCIVQRKLGLKQIGCFDLSAACSGFVFGITTANQFIKTGFAKHVLVIGAETYSRILDYKDRSTCVLFGDGAGAAVVSEVKEAFGILSSNMAGNGKVGEDVLSIPGGGSFKPFSQEVLDKRLHFMQMNGKSVYKTVVSVAVPSIKNALKAADLTLNDVDYFIPHQANLRIIEYLGAKLKLKPEQVFVNVDKYGNTSAATIPIALCEAAEQGLLRDAHIVVLSGFGAGFTWGASVLRWGGRKH